jgi:hypothetical protein
MGADELNRCVLRRERYFAIIDGHGPRRPLARRSRIARGPHCILGQGVFAPNGDRNKHNSDSKGQNSSHDGSPCIRSKRRRQAGKFMVASLRGCRVARQPLRSLAFTSEMPFGYRGTKFQRGSVCEFSIAQEIGRSLTSVRERAAQ